jgi:putative ABC transport system substrate-binding protein
VDVGDGPPMMPDSADEVIEMKRRQFMTLLGGAAAWPAAARAQQGERVRRIGVLMSFAAGDPESRLRIAALEKGLRELGWVDGRNLRIEYRWADNPDALRSHATELAAMTPDLIVANSTPVMAALAEQTRTVPIVFAQVTDPVGQGFVANLGRPGGHVTGFTIFEFSIGTKWLETLREVAPHVVRVAVVFNPETAPFADLFWQPIEAAARSFGITPTSAGVRSTGELERMAEAFAREPNGGLMVLPDVSTTNHRALLVALAARHRLPAVYPFRAFATSGGLLSYGADVADVFRRVATYVDRILKGTSPGDLPVQAPDKYELVINLKTANALGLTVPPTLLARADEVIE